MRIESWQVVALARIGFAVVAFLIAAVGPMPNELTRLIVMAAAVGAIFLA